MSASQASILRPLADRRVAALWGAQLASATGAELYAVAVVWTAASLIGRDAGYVSALQSAALLLGSLLGGLVTDRWRHGATLVRAGLFRAALLALLAGAAALGLMSLPVLAGAAGLAALATAVNDPALQGTLPALVPDAGRRHAVNGLFDATRRMARILGPGLVALLGGLLPVGGFFLVAAAALAAAALAVRRGLAGAALPEPTAARGLAAVRAALAGGAAAVRHHRLIHYGLAADFVGNVAWSAGVLLGLALLLRAASPAPLADYGLVMAAYGVGNLAANLALARRRPRRPLLWLVGSKLTFGLGVTLMPFAPGQAALMAAAALAGVNGPLENLALLHVIQGDVPPARIAPVCRLQMCAAFGGTLLGYAAAPALFALLGLRPAIAALGALTFATGLAGLGWWAAGPRLTPRAALPIDRGSD